MLQYLFRSYGKIGKTPLKENVIKMMGTYEPAEHLACLIDQTKRGQEFEIAGGQTIF